MKKFLFLFNFVLFLIYFSAKLPNIGEKENGTRLRTDACVRLEKENGATSAVAEKICLEQELSLHKFKFIAAIQK